MLKINKLKSLQYLKQIHNQVNLKHKNKINNLNRIKIVKQNQLHLKIVRIVKTVNRILI